jgi:rhomboid protease GluP
MSHEDTRYSGMDAEPTMPREAHGSRDGPAAPAIPPPRETFRIQFRPGATRLTPVNAGLRGRGTLVIEEHLLTLRGRQGLRHGFAGTTRTLDLEHIFNVQRSGRYIYFAFNDPASREPPQNVILRACNNKQAEDIVARLPAATVPGFNDRHADIAQFRNRLDECSGPPHVTTALVLINLAVYVAMCIGGVGVIHAQSSKTIPWGTNFGPLTLFGQSWRLLTSIFVHFGLAHVAINMLVLARVGPIIERLFGRFRFAVIYLTAGLAGSLCSLLVHPELNCAGASGAIFGILGAFFVFVVNKRNQVPAAVMRMYTDWIVVFTVLSLFSGFHDKRIDHAAHVGGLLAGLLMGYLLARPLRAQDRSRPRWKATGARIAAGALALALLAVPAMHPTGSKLAKMQFRHALMQLFPRQKDAIAATRAVMAQRYSVDSETLARRIGSDVLPKWQQLQRSVTEHRLDRDDPDYPLQSALGRYFTDRVTQYEILSQLDYLERTDRHMQDRSLRRLKQAVADAGHMQTRIDKLLRAHH